MSWRIRPTRVPTVFTACGLVLLFSLGTWQLNRRSESASLRIFYAERLAEPAVDVGTQSTDLDWRRGYVEGVPEWDRHVVVMGKYMWMQPGQHLIVPVRTAAGRVVLVNIGWVPTDEYEAIVGREAAIPGARRFEGLARELPPDPQARGTFPEEAGRALRWRAVDVRAMADAMALHDVAPALLIEGEGLAVDADIPDRVPPIGGWRVAPPERPHGEYAVTWFSLAITLVGVWLSLSVRRDSPDQGG